MFPEEPFIYGGHYSWLPGVVGFPLQLDIFFPQLSLLGGRPLAVEVQGEQRRTWVRHFGSKANFIRQKENDTRKRELLEARHIPLVEFWPEDEIHLEAITKKIEEVVGGQISG